MLVYGGFGLRQYLQFVSELGSLSRVVEPEHASSS